MGNYTPPGWAKAYTQFGFAIALAFALGWLLSSPFLGLLTFAILAYFPIDDETSEEQINGIGFATLMFVILLWAFGAFANLGLEWLSGAQGLGIDLGIAVGWAQIAALTVLVGAVVFKGIFLAAKGELFKTSDTQLVDAGSVVILFLIFIVNIIIFQPWNWNFAAILFAGIWFMTFFNGIFGGKEIKQTFGVVIIVIAFLIYTFGIGSDQVGGAAFGNWWPPVKEFGKQVFDPIKDAALTMYKSFKDSMQLLLCPTCVARDVLQGVYANPTGKGKVGAFGVEFEDLSVPDGSIILARPFNINLGIKNQGAKEAKDVAVRLYIGGSNVNYFKLAANQGDVTIQTSKIPTEPTLPQEDAKQLPVNGQITCANLPNLKDVVQETGALYKGGQFIGKKLDQLSKAGTGQTSSASVADYKFNTSFVNIRAEAEYSYSIDSQLQLEFISKTERARLLKDKTLERKKVRSQMTTSPVALSLFVDIDQPIEEQTNFFLGVEAAAQEPDGEAKNVVVNIKLPVEFGDLDSIVVTGATKGPKTDADWYEVVGNKEKLIKWHIAGKLKQEENIKQTKKLFLDFPADTVKLGTKPTKSFIVTADAEYTFTKWKETTASYSFGGFCCPGLKIDGQCRTGTDCEQTTGELGNCVVDGKQPTDLYKFAGKSDYCKQKPIALGVNEKCDLGEGGCTKGSNECIGEGEDKKTGPPNLACTDINVGVNVCCDFISDTRDIDKTNCKTAYNTFINKQRRLATQPA